MNGKQTVVGAAVAEDVITQQPLLMIAPRLPSGPGAVWLQFELCQQGLQRDEGLI